MEDTEPGKNEFRFVRGELRYRVMNMENARGPMRCLLAVERNGEIVFQQAVNLDSGRGRAEVERKVFEICKVGGVATDLMNVSIGIMKRLQETMTADRAKEQAGRQGYVLTKKQTDVTIKWAKDHPRILYDMIEFTSRTGIIREFRNRILLFLLSVSRKLEHPISGIGKGDSASGKSHLASAIFKLLPEEDLVEYTRITGAALFYRDEYSLQHKVFFVREAPGSEGSEHSLRTFMTEGDLMLSTVQKDESGKNVTTDMKVRGPVAFYTTTTQVEINPENETRLMQVHADESADTTCAFHRVSAWRAQYGGIDANPDELLQWRNFQRVLTNNAEVVVPFAGRLMKGFPSESLRSRRDFGRLLELIKACAYAHQFHRERKPIVDSQMQPKEVIVASIADYAIVKRIVEESIMKSAADVKFGQDALLDAVRALGEMALCEEAAHRPIPAGIEIHREDDGTVIWIATPVIYKHLGKTQRAVRDLIKAMEDQGLLAVMPNRKPIRVRLGDKAVIGGLELPTISPDDLFKDAEHERVLLYDPLQAPDFDQIHKFEKE
jgi:hypothetical protein